MTVRATPTIVVLAVAVVAALWTRRTQNNAPLSSHFAVL
jgi:hypothetical protein